MLRNLCKEQRKNLHRNSKKSRLFMIVVFQKPKKWKNQVLIP